MKNYFQVPFTKACLKYQVLNFIMSRSVGMPPQDQVQEWQSSVFMHSWRGGVTPTHCVADTQWMQGEEK